MNEFLEILVSGMLLGAVIYELAQIAARHMWKKPENYEIKPTYFVKNIDGSYSEVPVKGQDDE